MNQKLKNIVKPLLSGIVLSIVLTLIMMLVTINFQIILVLSTVLFYVAGHFNRSIALNIFVKLILILWSFLILFIVIVLPELPSLFYFPVIWTISLGLGLWRAARMRLKWIAITIFGISTFYAVLFEVPLNIQDNLTMEVFEQLPTPDVHTLSNKNINTSKFNGKVTVIDFFGTWCKPCIQELKELHVVQQAFEKDTMVDFVVINADMGGDTPEKFERFVKQQPYAFQYLYDHKSTFYKKVQGNTTGLPLLLVVDKDGIIRWKHIGYNPAETDFTENLAQIIRSMNSEK